MLTLLRIWSGVAAVMLAASETYLNLAVYGGKPLPILLPDYVIAAWLLAGAIFPRQGPKLLVSGWGVALGNYYGVVAENVEYHQPPTFFLAALCVVTGISLVCLVVANYCTGTGSQSPDVKTKRRNALLAFLRILGLLFAVFVVTAQIFTSWGLGKPISLLAPYYAISVGLASTVFFLHRMPELALSLWSVAFGFFYLEYSGYLIFFERPAWVLALASVATAAGLVGLVSQSVYVTVRSRGPAVPPL